MKTILLTFLLIALPLGKASVRFDADADFLSKTTGLAQRNPATYMAWVYLDSDPDDFQTFFNRSTAASGENEYNLSTDATGVVFRYKEKSASATTGSTLTVGTWYHVASVNNGTAHFAYLNGVQDIDLGTFAEGSDGSPTYKLGNGTDVTTEGLDGRMAAIKVYEAALSLEEIRNEIRSYRPKRTADLYQWLPMVSSANFGTDFSGKGRDMTENGTLAYNPGPPISWK